MAIRPTKGDGTTLLDLKLYASIREEEERVKNHRQNAVLTLMYDYLIGIGYTKTAHCLEEESLMGVNSYKLADNIDLMKILIEFESYHQMKYGRKIKLMKDNQQDEGESNKKNGSKAATKAKAATSRTHARSSLSSSTLPAMKPSITCLPPIPFVTNSSSSPSPSPTPPSSKKSDNDRESLQSLRAAASAQSISASDSSQMEISGISYSSSSSNDSSLLKETEDFPFNVPQPQNLFSLPPSLSTGPYAELAAMISRDVIMNVADTHWNDVIALEPAKQLLSEALVLPLQFPQLFTGLLAPWKGVLLYGPPGLKAHICVYF